MHMQKCYREGEALTSMYVYTGEIEERELGMGLAKLSSGEAW